MSKFEKWVEDENRERVSLDRPSMGRLLAYLKPHRYLIGSSIVLVLFGTAFGLLETRILGWMIDQAIVPRNLDRAKFLAGLYLVTEILRWLSIVFYTFLFSRVGQKVMQDMRMDVFSHLQGLPTSTLDQNPVGRLVTRVTNDISALSEMFSAGFATILVNLAFIFGNGLALLLLDFKLGLVVLTVFPPLAWSAHFFTGRLRNTYRDARSKLSALNALLAETILGIRVVHLFDQIGARTRLFFKMNDQYAQAQVSSVRVYALLQPTITFASGVAIALAIYFGAYRVVFSGLSIGVLVAFFSYANALFQPVRDLAEKWNIFLSGMASAERIFSILDWKLELDPREFANPPGKDLKFKGEIRFEDVWFAYKPGRWVLKGLNLTLSEGSNVGIIGPTGAGKSSLISLLLRFYSPTRGRILLDGRDLQSYPLRELRSRFGYVQQEGFLFSGTIAENISLWRPIENEVLEEDLGFKSRQLQERGSNLSTGERQTLSFARALVKNPDLWILDEATSNMDSSTEEKWMEWLRKYAKGKTCLWIAHRLATLRSVDLIIVLQAGQVSEMGTHDELLSMKGYYSELYRLQSLRTESKRPFQSGESSPGIGT